MMRSGRLAHLAPALLLCLPLALPTVCTWPISSTRGVWVPDSLWKLCRGGLHSRLPLWSPSSLWRISSRGGVWVLDYLWKGHQGQDPRAKVPTAGEGPTWRGETTAKEWPPERVLGGRYPRVPEKDVHYGSDHSSGEAHPLPTAQWEEPKRGALRLNWMPGEGFRAKGDGCLEAPEGFQELGVGYSGPGKGYRVPEDGHREAPEELEEPREGYRVPKGAGIEYRPPGEGYTFSEEGYLHRQEEGRRRLVERVGSARGRAAIRRRRTGGCWSQQEQQHFYKHFRRSQEFEEALLAYERLHKRCTNVSDWANYAAALAPDWKKDRGHLEGCKYLVYSAPSGHGLGNQIISFVSAFALALVTNRTLLMRSSTPLSQFTCSHMRGASFALNDTLLLNFLTPMWRTLSPKYAWGNLDALDKHDDPRLFHMGLGWNTPLFEQMLFCTAYHERILQRLPVWSIEADQYYLPGLHLVPEFNQRLKQLFPDDRAFLHIGRLLLHPQNHIWLKVVRFFRTYLAHHSSLVGIQVRELWPCKEPVEGRILECAQSVAQVLPKAIPAPQFITQNEGSAEVGGAWRAPDFKKHITPSIGVIVASLNRKYADFIYDQLTARVPENGELVGVYSLSHEGVERIAVDQYEQAFVEMILLSMCDHLLVTEYSTFGYIATGLAGVDTHTMNIVWSRAGDWRTNGRPVCQKVSSEPCFLRFPGQTGTVECDGNSRNVTEIVEGLQQCEAMNYGLTYRTDDAEHV